MDARSRGEKSPVLLVPGAFGQDYVYWNVMEHLMEREGYPVFSVTFPTFTLTDLRVSAHLLASRVLEVQEQTGAEQVSLVAHSMGGLISRYFLQTLKGARHTRRLVCLGTPHRGTYTGLAGYPLRGARQIVPGSPFLTALNDPRALQHGVPITNIWSEHDYIIMPRGNAALDGPNVTNLVYPGGHWALLYSPRVLRQVLQALDHDAPPGPPAAASRVSAGPARAGATDAPA